jgi:hypothetical protein
MWHIHRNVVWHIANVVVVVWHIVIAVFLLFVTSLICSFSFPFPCPHNAQCARHGCSPATPSASA